ncbi:MAG TPA: hypothetical protein VGN52_25465 [Burkholderiales bacterium]|jgi:hypothetical protein
MISLSQFLARRGERDPLAIDDISRYWCGASDAAVIALGQMPGIGFASVKKRMAAFLAVCRHLEDMKRQGELSEEEAFLALFIMRAESLAFSKACIMFEIRGRRFKPADRAALPQVAQDLLAVLEP